MIPARLNARRLWALVAIAVLVTALGAALSHQGRAAASPPVAPLGSAI